MHQCNLHSVPSLRTFSSIPELSLQDHQARPDLSLHLFGQQKAPHLADHHYERDSANLLSVVFLPRDDVMSTCK
jgi:hypothetical protein